MVKNPKVIRILGIDPGFDRLGVCIVDKEGNNETLVYSGCITTPKQKTFEERLVLLGKDLNEIITKYKPNEVAIETIFITKNQKTVIQVAEVRGVCIYLSKLNNISLFEYSPPQIKIAITGYGRATKEDVSLMVPKIVKMQKTLEKENLFDDEIDSIAIALTHSAHRKMGFWGRR
jgi:crossover junction endodeoxyribonuclease RuvC